MIELLFARGAAEVIRLPFVIGSSSGGSRFYFHSAYKILYCCCVGHYRFPFVRELWLCGRSTVDWRFWQCIITTRVSIAPR
jgi:hypothetical protein